MRRRLRSHSAPAMTGGSSIDMRLSGARIVDTHGSPRFSATIGMVTVSGCETRRSAPLLAASSSSKLERRYGTTISCTMKRVPSRTSKIFSSSLW